ncbi:MAG: 4-hydroxy-tetrahydrodipicolinate reductase [Planctomycetia bacterium]|nr:4-hydroxy-tetrahydrodipicolinate reductase [Planctomycetia bacterium]
MANEISLLVNGVCGRMGLRIIHLASADKRFQVAAGLEHADHPKGGMDLGLVAALPELEGIAITHAWPKDRVIDLVIDVSSPEGTASLLPLCKVDRIPMVVATTGHSVQQMNALKEAAHDMPLLVAANLSLGMNLMMKLVGQAAAALKTQDFDIEIIERHHRFKKDSPSGTALRLSQIIQEQVGEVPVKHGREGIVGERSKQEIGIHAVRAGDNVGDHTVLFSTLGETLELQHKASSRDAFAKGALEAAAFLISKGPGWYTMADVLGL